jgi:hypothetical protein
LPGATKGNTLKTARIKLCDGDSKTTAYDFDLKATTAAGCRGLVRDATSYTGTAADHFPVIAVGPKAAG